MSRVQLRARELEVLRAELSGRDLAIVAQVAELRLMTGRQIEAVHFSPASHESAEAASRACRRSLERLARDRVLVRADRRLGGARSGSGSFIYALGPIGHRLLALQSPRPRYREASVTFANHTIAVAQLVVDMTLAARAKVLDVLICQAEPRCWREFATMGASATLRPDLFLALGVVEYEHRWFCEVDNATEHLPAVIRKCRVYEAYYRSGREQAAHGVFPRVCWLVSDQRRAASIRRGIDSDRRLTNDLFVVIPFTHAIKVLSGEHP